MSSRTTTTLATFVLLAFTTGAAHPAGPRPEQGSREEARAMTEKVAVWVKKYGKEKTLAEINRAATEKAGEFIDRDLYIFAYDFNGLVLAHGQNQKMIGKNLLDLQDADGRYLIQGLIATAKKGSGWYYYKWANPITKMVDAKEAYVIKIDDGLWVGCGVYGKMAKKT